MLLTYTTFRKWSSISGSGRGGRWIWINAWRNELIDKESD